MLGPRFECMPAYYPVPEIVKFHPKVLAGRLLMCQCPQLLILYELEWVLDLDIPKDCSLKTTFSNKDAIAAPCRSLQSYRGAACEPKIRDFSYFLEDLLDKPV